MQAPVPQSQLLFAHHFMVWEIAPELINSQLIVHLSALHKLFPALLVCLSEGFLDGHVDKEKYLLTLKKKKKVSPVKKKEKHPRFLFLVTIRTVDLRSETPSIIQRPQQAPNIPKTPRRSLAPY